MYQVKFYCSDDQDATIYSASNHDSIEQAMLSLEYRIKADSSNMVYFINANGNEVFSANGLLN